MFDRLKNKWKVNGWQLFLILCTFAIGGSCCGYLGRFFLKFFGIEKVNPFVYFPLYIILITLLWPLCVIVISIFLGQYSFFKNYLIKVANKLGLKNNNEN